MRSFNEMLNSIKHYKKNSDKPVELQRLIDAADKVECLEATQAIKVREMVKDVYNKIHLVIRKARSGDNSEKAIPKAHDLMSHASKIRKDKKVTWLQAKQEAAKIIADKRHKEEKKAMRDFNKKYRKQLSEALKGVKDKEVDAHHYAHPPGKRLSAQKKVYYENRANRSDISGRKKYPML